MIWLFLLHFRFTFSLTHKECILHSKRCVWENSFDEAENEIVFHITRFPSLTFYSLCTWDFHSVVFLTFHHLSFTSFFFIHSFILPVSVWFFIPFSWKPVEMMWDSLSLKIPIQLFIHFFLFPSDEWSLRIICLEFHFHDSSFCVPLLYSFWLILHSFTTFQFYWWTITRTTCVKKSPAEATSCNRRRPFWWFTVVRVHNRGRNERKEIKDSYFEQEFGRRVKQADREQ